MVITKQEQIFEAFESFKELITDLKLRLVCNDLKVYPEFWTHTASEGFHHAFNQGLIVHTLEVTHNAVHIAKLCNNIDLNVLVTAALWHDVAKIWDYKKVGDEWKKTWYHGNIHHISGSNAEFTASAIKYGVDRPTIQEIQHCILAHHGCKEFNSVRVPNSIEAVVLHQADMISAKNPRNIHAPSP